MSSSGSIHSQLFSLSFLEGAALLPLLLVVLFLLRGVAWPPSLGGVAFSLLLLRAAFLLLLPVGLLSPPLLLGGAARHQLRKGLVPKTAFDPPESFDLGSFSQTFFFWWTNFHTEKREKKKEEKQKEEKKKKNGKFKNMRK